jgi:hypothetical protein
MLSDDYSYTKDPFPTTMCRIINLNFLNNLMSHCFNCMIVRIIPEFAEAVQKTKKILHTKLMDILKQEN